MCYSIEVSLVTFLITSLCMLYVYSKSVELKWIATFVMIVTTIQLCDALLWMSINNNNIELNMFVSKYMLSLVLVSELLVAYYGAKSLGTFENKIYELFLWLYVIFFMIMWIATCKATNRNSDGYLTWCDYSITPLMKILFLFFLIVPFICGYTNEYIKISIVSVCIATFILNFYKKSFGSGWCHISNILSIILVVLVALGYAT